MAAQSIRLPSRAGVKALFIDHVSPQTRLLEKRRQVFEVEEALEAQKEEFARREEAFRRREEGLKKKDLELTEAFIRFNQVVTENEAKKTRAEKKAAEEANATLKKETDIDEAVDQLQELRQEVSELHMEKQRLENYHKFLDKFQRAYPEEFIEVSSILERYRTLLVARQDLLKEKSRLADGIEEQRKLLARIQKAASTQVLTSENVVTKLKDRLEDMRSTVQALQQGAEDATVTKGGQVLELGQVLQCVHNLHSRCTLSDAGQIVKHTPSDGEVLGFSHFEGALADAMEQADALSAAVEKLEADEAAEESGAPASPQPPPPAPPTSKEIAGMESNVLRRRLRDAIGLLHVVGSYIQDFECIMGEYSAWQADQKRKQGEKDAALAAEAHRLAAARAARSGRAPAPAARSPARDGATRLGATAGAMGKSLGKSPLPEKPSTAKRDFNVTGASSLSMSASGLNTTTTGGAGVLNATTDGLHGAINVRGAKVYVVKGAKLEPDVLAKLTGAPATSGYASYQPSASSGGAAASMSLRRSTVMGSTAMGSSTMRTSRMPAASPLKIPG